MAGSVKVASFFASLGVEVDDRGFAKAQNKMSGLKTAVTGFLAAAGVFQAGRFLKNAVDEVTELGDNVGKLSKGLGISANALQRFKFAAQRSGVEFSELRSALGRLPKNLDAASHGSLEMKRAFEELGVSTSAMLKLSPEDQFLKMSDSLKKIKDPTRRTIVAMNIFGRSGAKLIPLLDEGSEGINGLGDRLQALGGIMSDEAVKASEDWQDSLTNLDSIMLGIKTTIVVSLLPWLQAVAKWLTSMAESGALQRTLSNVWRLIRGLGLAAAATAASFGIMTLSTKAMTLGIWGSVKALGALLLRLLTLAAPIVLVVALGLVFDDLWTFIKGGDSVMGRFLDWLKEAKSDSELLNIALDAIRFTFGGLGEAIAIAFEWLSDFVGLLAGGDFSKAVEKMLSWGRALSTFSAGSVKRINDALRSDLGIGENAAPAATLSDLGVGGNVAPTAAAAATASTNSSSISADIKIETKADNPAEIKRAVMESLNDVAAQAKSQLTEAPQ